MEIQESYNIWAKSYDSDNNLTRDLEAEALRETLGGMKTKICLELGCGTGKNTEWLAGVSEKVIAVDFSDKMLDIAKRKSYTKTIEFIKADIAQPWNFLSDNANLIVCSLVLEHLEDLQPFFAKAAKALASNGYLYVGELHPFKQYLGSHARFENEDGQVSLKCFTHNISDFVGAAKKNGFALEELKEFFDNNNPQGVPRILTLLFKKTY